MGKPVAGSIHARLLASPLINLVIKHSSHPGKYPAFLAVEIEVDEYCTLESRILK